MSTALVTPADVADFPIDARPVDALKGDYLEVITDRITKHPRSQQLRIGPSGIGNPCDRCLAYDLAEIPAPRDGDDGWLPTIGTATHTWLDDAFTAPHGLRWLTEARVSIGDINGMDVSGNVDLYDRATCTVIDHKIVGATTLKKAKRKSAPGYRVQKHAYGRGYIRAGFPVKHVALAYLPRNGALHDAVFNIEPYDEQIVLDALARCERLHTNVTALQTVSHDALIAWIEQLPRHPDCWDCARRPNADGTRNPRPGHHAPEDTFNDLLPTG